MRTVIGGGGAVKETRDFYPFGLRMPGRSLAASSPTSEDYTGHELDDATGLHYAGARYYMSALGRWTTTDPILRANPKELLKQDVRLLGMSPYNYAFNNPTNLVDPRGLAPEDWYRDSDGKIKYDEEVQSQSDLEKGQTYLGESVLLNRNDGSAEFLSASGDRIGVFDSGQTSAEEGALGVSGASVAAAKQRATLDLARKGSQALSRLKTATRVVGQGATGASFGLSVFSEFAEGDPLGTYEMVKFTADAGLAGGSLFGGPIGAGAAFLLEATNAKKRFVRAVTIKIMESQADYVVPSR